MPKPTAVFPGSVVTDARLKIATNRLTTRLAASLSAGATTMTVADATGIVANSLLSIYLVDSRGNITGAVEIVSVDAAPAGNVLPSITRGYDGTTAATHASGAYVAGFVDAWHHNALVAEVEAIEQALGANLGTGLLAPSFDFSAQTPGGSLVVGANSITLTPVPQGVSGTDTLHYLYIDNGTGTAEAVPIIGGTAVSGGTTGTVIVTCAHTHSGAWRVRSATAGIQEALQVVAAPGGAVTLPAGSYTLYAQVYIPYANTALIRGAGRSATVINVDAGFSLSHLGVFRFSPAQVSATNADSGGVSGLTIGFTQPDSIDPTTYTHWPPAIYISGNNHVTIEDVVIERAWDGITSPLSNGITVRNVGMSYFHRGLSVDLCYDILNVSQLEGWVFGLTANQTTAFIAVATANYLLDLQQVDYGWLDGVLSVSGKFAKLYANGTGGVPIIHGTNIDMDTNGGFEMSNGYVRLSNINASLLPGTEAFVLTGGTLSLDGVSIFNSGSTTTHFLVNILAANAGAAAGLQPGLTISNLKLSSNAEDGYIVYATTSGAFAGTAYIRVTGAEIFKSPGVSYTKQLFVEAAGTGSMIMDISHVKIAPNGAVSAPAFNFSSSLSHSVSFCDGPLGWTYGVPSTTNWFGNTGFATLANSVPAATKFAARASVATFAALQTENYIASETGANNAIAGALIDAAGVDVPLAAGLKVTVKLAHTLQAGANTLALNAGTAKAIKQSSNLANLSVAYSVGSLLTVIYDGTQFQDMRQ